MATKVVLFVFCVIFANSVAADDRLRLNSSISLPLHYNVELTIDIDGKSYSVDESILITILEDTQVIEINSFDLEVDWVANSKVISAEEGGQEFYPVAWTEEKDRNCITLEFGEVIPGGANYTLYIAGAKGAFGGGLLEVPLSASNADDSNDRYLLSTGFNRTNLRAVFPCYDEPMYRTTFEFTIYHKSGLNLITNTADVSTVGPIPEKNNYLRRTFKIDEKLSTISVGFVLTNMNMHSSAGNRVRVYHPIHSMSTFLVNTYYRLLLAVEQELNVPLDITTLEVVYVPALRETKTLTKWGLILIGPEMNPVENSVVHSKELKEIQKEIARSVYQLFFGQLLSPEWWSDQWVLLGLARYFSGVTKHLPFDAEKEFVVDTVQMVIRDKFFFPTIAIAREYYTIDEINTRELFVIDQRPAPLMRWIGHIIGEENFREAILSFLAINRYSSISGQEFMLYLDSYTSKALLPVQRSLSEVIWFYVNAMPDTERLYVGIDEGASSFRLFRWTSEFNVDLSIDYMTTAIEAASEPKLWLEPNLWADYHLDIELEPWIVMNPDQYGIYVVNYDDDLWTELARQLMINHEKFNRGQLISDSFSEARSTTGRLRNYLNLIEYLPKETDTLTWRAARISFERLMVLMRGYEGDLEPMNEYFNSLAGDLYLSNRMGSEMVDFEKTMELAKIVCVAGLPECLQDVKDYYEAALGTESGLIGSSDFQQFVYCTLARNSSDIETLMDQVLQLWVEDRSEYSKSRNALQGLACTADVTVIQRFLNMSVTDQLEQDFGVSISPSERRFLLHTFMRGSFESAAESLNFILENFSIINEMVDSVQKLFVGYRYHMRPRKMGALIDKITNAHREEMGEALHTFVVVERIIGSSFFFGNSENIQSQFETWLAQRETEPDHGALLRPMEFIVLFALTTIAYFCNNTF